MTKTPTYRYRGFGLDIESEIKLPMLEADFESPHVRIDLGPTPTTIKNPTKTGMRFEVAADEFLLKVDTVANYWVRNGDSIKIHIIKKVTSDEINLFLLGSVFAALLHQRGSMVLHGSAISDGTSGIAFIGNSGAGKSTIATALQKRGYKAVTDDLCVITFDDSNIPYLEFGYPQSKLWNDSLIHLNINPDSLPCIRKGIEKHYFPTNTNFDSSRTPLTKIFLLSPKKNEKPATSKLNATESLQAIKAHTYRNQFLTGESQLNSIFFKNTTLAKVTPTFLAQRTDSFSHFDLFINMIQKEIEK